VHLNPLHEQDERERETGREGGEREWRGREREREREREGERDVFYIHPSHLGLINGEFLVSKTSTHAVTGRATDSQN
jgi:hypothetical protein